MEVGLGRYRRGLQEAMEVYRRAAQEAMEVGEAPEGERCKKMGSSTLKS